MQVSLKCPLEVILRLLFKLKYCTYCNGLSFVYNVAKCQLPEQLHGKHLVIFLHANLTPYITMWVAVWTAI